MSSARHRHKIASRRQRGFAASAIFTSVKNILIISCLYAVAVESVPTPVRADEPLAPASSSAATPSAGTRHGLFDWLDHRSEYGGGIFPEPFLVDDSALEVNEARLDWLHTGRNGQHRDEVKAEVEKGFGLLTLELEVPYERDTTSGQTSQGIGNIDLGARYPVCQFVSGNGFVDSTLGAAIEVGIPVNSVVSKNTELVPKLFDDLKLGDHFTLQSIAGWSTLFGGGDDGGLGVRIWLRFRLHDSAGGIPIARGSTIHTPVRIERRNAAEQG